MLLIFFSVLGSFSAILLFWAKEHSEDNDGDGYRDEGGFNNAWVMAGILAIIGNGCYGAGFVMYNAYLPIIVRAHPEYIKLKNEQETEDTQPKIQDEDEESENHDQQDDEEDDNDDNPTSPLNKSPQKTADSPLKSMTSLDGKDEPLLSPLDQKFNDLADYISGTGFVYGYISTVLCTFIGLIFVLFIVASWDGVRVVLLLMGLWWFGFSLITFYYLKKRPGPPLPLAPDGTKSNYIVFSWKRAYYTILEIWDLPQTFRFLISYFLFSDIYSTIAGVGILFGQLELGMTTAELTILSLVVPLCSFIGVYLHFWIQKYLDASHTTMLFISLFELAVIPFYGILGFIPSNPVGLKNSWFLFLVVILLFVCCFLSCVLFY